MNLVALWRGRRRCGSNASRSLAASGGCAPLPAMTGNRKSKAAPAPARWRGSSQPTAPKEEKAEAALAAVPQAPAEATAVVEAQPPAAVENLAATTTPGVEAVPPPDTEGAGVDPPPPAGGAAASSDGGQRSRQTYRGSSTATKAPTAPAPEAALDALQDPENKDHLEKVTRALKAIQDQWPGVQGELAFGIDENANAEEQGCRAIWDPEEFRIAVATPARAYECAGNLLHSNLVQQACKGVRSNRSNVQRLQNAFFKDVESAAMPLTVVVAVESGVDPNDCEGGTALPEPLGSQPRPCAAGRRRDCSKRRRLGWVAPPLAHCSDAVPGGGLCSGLPLGSCAPARETLAPAHGGLPDTDPTGPGSCELAQALGRDAGRSLCSTAA